MSSFGRDEWGRSGRLGQRHFRRLSRGRRALLDLRRRQAYNLVRRLSGQCGYVPVNTATASIE